jgi:hypothetical protein
LTDKKGNIIKEVVGQTKQGEDIVKTVTILDRQAMSKRENLLQLERKEQREILKTESYATLGHDFVLVFRGKYDFF